MLLEKKRIQETAASANERFHEALDDIEVEIVSVCAEPDSNQMDGIFLLMAVADSRKSRDGKGPEEVASKARGERKGCEHPDTAGRSREKHKLKDWA